MKIVNRLILIVLQGFVIPFFYFGVIPQIKDESHTYDSVKSLPMPNIESPLPDTKMLFRRLVRVQFECIVLYKGDEK